VAAHDGTDGGLAPYTPIRFSDDFHESNGDISHLVFELQGEEE